MAKLATRLSLLAAAFTALPAGAGEALYNGIVLPDVWPPRIERLSGGPMPVPYLEHRPAVVPIEVGRQLLVDDFLIESTTLARTFYATEPYPQNPVLKPERRWEKAFKPGTTTVFSDGVWWDPKDQLYKLWYRADCGNTCFATSTDGLRWTRPAFDVQPGTNVVLLSGFRDSSTVWLDLEESDPARRWKLFQFHRDCWLPSLHFSGDGVHWTSPLWCGQTGDRSTLFYNPFRKVWVFSIRAQRFAPPWDYKSQPAKPCGRSRRYWECKDLATGCQWPPIRDGEALKPGQPTWWVTADRLDEPGLKPTDIQPELYNLDAAPYESLMLGQFSVLRSNSVAGRPKLNDVQFGFSRDGFHWHRPWRQATIPVSSDPAAWNYGNVQSGGGGCLVVGDRLHFYFSGRSSAGECTGLAFLRRDGFASMDAGPNEGQLTTRPLVFHGKHAFVNVACPAGQLVAEVLDRDSRPIAPFTRANSVPVRCDKTRQTLTWRGAADLSAVAGLPVRLRFFLTSGRLYAFWVSPDRSGASHGYVAAGGRGFTGSRDTVGGE